MTQTNSLIYFNTFCTLHPAMN